MSAEMSNPADLFFQAFRYASNEMTPAERQEFDSLLAADQPAREAVARVIELEGLVFAVESTPAESTRVTAVSPLRPALPSYWMQPVGWVALGAAACLAAVMAFQAWWPSANAALQVPAAAPLVAVAHPNTKLDVRDAVAGDVVAGDAVAGDAVAGDVALAWARAQAQLPAHDDAAVEINQDTLHRSHFDPDHPDQDSARLDDARLDDEQLAAAPAWLFAAVADTEAMDVEN